VSIIPTDSSEPITEEMWAQLRAAYADGQRLATAFALALDVDACADLLAGRTVDPSRLDEGELFKARRKRLVQLVAPVNLLEPSGLEPAKEASNG
jgi:hypothetical protein